MQGFESSFRRHLALEQRRAILEAIARTLDPDATVGEVLDAAERLGWGAQIGEFSLAEIATAMVTAPQGAPHLLDGDAESRESTHAEEDEHGLFLADASYDEDEDEDEDDLEDDEAEAEDDLGQEEEEEEEEEEEDEYTRNLRVLLGPEKLLELQTASADQPEEAEEDDYEEDGYEEDGYEEDDEDDEIAPVVVYTTKKGSKKKGPKTTKKAGKKTAAAKGTTKAEDSRKRAARLRALKKKIDAEERMSLDEAAELFIPIVTELGHATMQDLEEFTGVGRRKLRFHVGQLVRHEYLQRHGMGRGTYYTVG